MKSWLLILACFSINQAMAVTPDPFKINTREVHQIKLLNHGLASFEERLEMIERARHTIDVEYFIYNLDKSGRIFTQALVEKARQGVKVRLLLDYFMIKSQLSPFYAHELESEGIEVKYFNATSSLNLGRGQYRNHRKVLLIDGVEAITGGRNIGDEYFDLRADFNFLDRDILVKGKIVSAIQETFNAVWDSELSLKMKRERMPAKTDAIYRRDKGVDLFKFQMDLKHFNEKISAAKDFLNNNDKQQVQVIREKARIELAEEYSGSCENMSFNSEYPIIGKKNRDDRIIKHNIAERIKNAKESVLFDSPYFIVDDQSRESLEEALAKNVRVTLLTNSLNSTDAIYVYDVFDSIIKKWIDKGLESYIFKGELPENYPTLNNEIAHARFGVHAKSFVFDKKDVVIGTFNFDPRSANFNTEMTISCDNNPELARLVTEDIESRIKGAIELDSKEKVDEVEFYNTGFVKKLTYYILKIPSNVFDYLL